jgi:hypothetical protein
VHIKHRSCEEINDSRAAQTVQKGVKKRKILKADLMKMLKKNGTLLLRNAPHLAEHVTYLVHRQTQVYKYPQ